MQELAGEQGWSKKFKATVEFGKKLLTERGCVSPDNALPGDAIYAEYLDKAKSQEEDAVDDIAQNTFIQYLSRAARTKNTFIFCAGRKQGYYTREEEVVEEEGEGTETSVAEGGNDEKDLYPVFTAWLADKGYKAKEVSTSKKNGGWGNPDVLGIRVMENFGSIESEIVTIECKKEFRGWSKWIFEAVAHTRFADRSYFAFPYPQDEIQKQADDLVLLAEYFGVGVLVLELEKAAYDDYCNGRKVDLQKGEVLELRPAPRNRPIMSEKIRYLAGIQVRTVSDLYEFGVDDAEK